MGGAVTGGLLPVTARDVLLAADAIAGNVVRTPAAASRVLSEITGAHVVVKFENFQFTASYKERGALTKLLSLTGDERARGVVTMSAGNFAQGVAHHAGRLGIDATIVMPRNTPLLKVARTRALRADVVLEGDGLDEAARVAAARSAKAGLVLLSPFDDPQVIAGQGTVAVEMLQDHPDLDVLLVPVGGGGLLAGMAVAARSMTPTVELVGVQAEPYAAMLATLEGSPQPPGGMTIAEGIAVLHPGALTAQIIGALNLTLLAVSEARIEEAMALYLEVEKVVAEGAGAASLAALLENPDRFRGRKVGVVLSGGNVDLRLLASVITRSLIRTGRLTMLRVAVPDSPGSLADLTTLVAERGGNIVEVHHRRNVLDVTSRAAQIDLVLETAHGADLDPIVQALQAAAIAVELLPPG
jgi:threonine dehydratase